MNHPVLVYRPIIPGKPGKDDIPLPGVLTDEAPASHGAELVVTTAAGTIRVKDIEGLIVDVQFSAEVDELLRTGKGQEPEAALTISRGVIERLAARQAARDAGWSAF